MTFNANIGSRASVLAYTSDQETKRRLNIIISALAAYDLTVEDAGAFVTSAGGAGSNADILIVDVGDGSLLDDDKFREVCRDTRAMPVIFLSEVLSPERMRTLMRLNGADWLAKPIQPRPVLEALNAITKKLSATKNMVHAVVSAGGGAGATSTAIMLAYELSRQHRKKTPTTALLDLDFSTGDVGAYLNIENGFDMATVLSAPERIDLEFVNLIRKTHSSGFNVFSFESPSLVFAPRVEELILRLVDVVAFQHDHTVVDLGNFDAPWSKSILHSVNTITIVANKNVPGIQHAKDLLRRVSELRGNTRDVSVVINRAKKNFFGATAGRKDVEKIFPDTPVVFIPEDAVTMTEALDRGVLPVEANERSAFCKAVARLADPIRNMAAG